MKPEIKQRIEQIKSGQVPEGYKKTRAGIMPCDWCADGEYRAKDIFKSVTNKKHNGEFEVLSATQDKGVIPRSQVDIDIKFNEDNIVGYKKVDKGDFVISLRSFQGGIEYSKYEGLVSPAYTVLKPQLPICDGYYKAYLKTVDYITRLNKGTYGIRDGKQIGFEDFGDMIVHYPSLAEQGKIAKILSAQDKVIELKEKLLEAKKKQKKHLMQQLLTGKKRLSGFSGEWENYRLKQVTKRLKQKNDVGDDNILTISAQHGLINQGEFFNKEIASEDKSNYYLLKRNDFAYNKSYSSGYPFGAIKRLIRYGRGIVSPLYICFQIVESVSLEYMEQYFEVGLMNREIQAFAQEGARNHGLLNIAVDDFFNAKILIPPYDEQLEIAKILSAADKEIDLIYRGLEREKQKKKALMQLLLTGIVRVNK